MKRKTNEEWIKQVYDLVGDEYIFLEEYKGMGNPILIIHNKCGNEYPVRAGNFVSGKRCPNCHRNSKKAESRIINDIFEKVGIEYTVLKLLRKNGKQYINIKHNLCGREYDVRYDAFIGKGDRCKCQLRKTHNKYLKEVRNAVGDEYTILGRYVESKTLILTRHNVCGYEWDAYPLNLIIGKCCPRCKNCERKTTERFKEQVFESSGNEYSVLSEYEGARRNILMFHHECENKYYVTPDNFLSKHQRCPRCQDSKGVKEIVRVLTELAIEHGREHRIDGCRYKRVLPFDVAVFENGELIMLIEFDGIQHFQPSEFHGGRKGFKEIKLRDSIKDKYCIDNNIPLLRIHYTQFDNIEEILKSKLMTHTLP
ncbi:hypothetical protein [Priestia megaterium]|uniref:hypothetical protein n=1 Tax=Priestia megaterium TaxID=1404 RepID=UPI003CF4B035